MGIDIKLPMNRLGTLCGVRAFQDMGYTVVSADTETNLIPRVEKLLVQGHKVVLTFIERAPVSVQRDAAYLKDMYSNPPSVVSLRFT